MAGTPAEYNATIIREFPPTADEWAECGREHHCCRSTHVGARNGLAARMLVFDVGAPVVTKVARLPLLRSRRGLLCG